MFGDPERSRNMEKPLKFVTKKQMAKKMSHPHDLTSLRKA